MSDHELTAKCVIDGHGLQQLPNTNIQQNNSALVHIPLLAPGNKMIRHGEKVQLVCQL